MPNTKGKRLTYKQSIDGYTDVGLCEGVTIDEAICKLADMEDAMPEWISVKDRLPKEDGIYLTCNKKKQYEFHLFQTSKRMWQAIWEEDDVTHWMPFPEQPKGE